MSKVYGFEEMSECPKCLTGRQYAGVKWGRFMSSESAVGKTLSTPLVIQMERTLGKNDVGPLFWSAEGPDMLRVECSNCGFVWLEEPADAEPKTSGPSERE